MENLAWEESSRGCAENTYLALFEVRHFFGGAVRMLAACWPFGGRARAAAGLVGERSLSF